MADDATATPPSAAQPAGSADEQVEALVAEATGEGAEIEVRGEKFHVATEIPAIVMLRMTAAGDTRISPAKQMGAVVQFLEHVIDAEDRDRFMDLLEDADPVIGFDELNDVVQAATEVIAARPTGPQ
jgi:hypothetical protein